VPNDSKTLIISERSKRTNDQQIKEALSAEKK
jgi:hypothetical protein